MEFFYDFDTIRGAKRLRWNIIMVWIEHHQVVRWGERGIHWEGGRWLGTAPYNNMLSEVSTRSVHEMRNNPRCVSIGGCLTTTVYINNY